VKNLYDERRNLYDFVVSEPTPWPGESKAVWILRRELKRAALAAFKKKFPGLWSRFDRAEHERRLAHWRQTWGRPVQGGVVTSMAKEMLVVAALGTDTGRQMFADGMARVSPGKPGGATVAS